MVQLANGACIKVAGSLWNCLYCIPDHREGGAVCSMAEALALVASWCRDERGVLLHEDFVEISGVLWH